MLSPVPPTASQRLKSSLYALLLPEGIYTAFRYPIRSPASAASRISASITSHMVLQVRPRFYDVGFGASVLHRAQSCCHVMCMIGDISGQSLLQLPALLVHRGSSHPVTRHRQPLDFTSIRS